MESRGRALHASKRLFSPPGCDAQTPPLTVPAGAQPIPPPAAAPHFSPPTHPPLPSFPTLIHTLAGAYNEQFDREELNEAYLQSTTLA